MIRFIDNATYELLVFCERYGIILSFLFSMLFGWRFIELMIDSNVDSCKAYGDAMQLESKLVYGECFVKVENRFIPASNFVFYD
ncbi:hypothetical protein J8L98_01375 [Pseudoalteromonas sp. MMG013]|uniref:hypothetical protein n=1 Tax=Pseudoalteromonas sp. MMG013 TaxID=2822687 RepID=UPI001B380494|nr:hypothetical protein [Pseudoalteromonas sp. MMG013]MBQ4860340.1 hypothetical protein [Pseudoalteromonas sp. MMG013]